MLNETDLPVYPDGWPQWAERMSQVVPEGIDAFFVGDRDYDDTLKRYFPESAIQLFDPTRSRYPISASAIPMPARGAGSTARRNIFWVKYAERDDSVFMIPRGL